MNNEIYKNINILNTKENMYSVSNFGNVKNNITGRILKTAENKDNNYLYVSLMQKDNTVKKVYVHRLVATAFIKIPKELLDLTDKLVPNHKDFNRHNNHVKNLEWTTTAANNYWNFINGHCKWCEDAPNAKVTNELVEDICRLMEKGYLNRDIFNILKLPKNSYYTSLLSRIRNGSEWKTISKNYNIENKNTLRKYDDVYIEKICEFLEKGYKPKEMWSSFGITTKEGKEKFKKLVRSIRLRKTYKDISAKYKW